MSTAVVASYTDTLLGTAQQFAPVLRERAAEAETLRTLPEDIVRDMKAAGLVRLGLPASLGGWEADPLTIFEVIETLSLAAPRAAVIALVRRSRREV